MQVTATDSGGSATKAMLVHLHGELEDTGEEWAEDYDGYLDLCDELGTKFAPGVLGFVINDTGQPMTTRVSVTREVSVTDGWSFQRTASVSTAVSKMLSLEFGAAVTYESKNTFSNNQQIGEEVQLPSGYTLVALWRYNGEASFPKVSKWNATGYDGDHSLNSARITARGLWFRTVPNGEGGI
jgi:hypothetical protein